MEQFLTFASAHPILVYSFIGVLGFILWTEYTRLTRKYKNVSAADAVRLINDDNSLCLDVREEKELSDGRIAGARHIPLSQLVSRIGEITGFKDKKVVVYCRSGNRSGYACNTLTKQGFEDVSNLDGGIIAWEGANYPLSKR